MLFLVFSFGLKGNPVFNERLQGEHLSAVSLSLDLSNI